MATYLGAGAQGTSAPLAVARPTVVAGDVMIALVGTSSPASDTGVTAPSGWTLVNTVQNDRKLWVFVKTATGSEPSTYSFGSSNVAGARAIIVAYRGVTLPVVASATSSANNNTVPFASVTATATNLLVMAAFASHAGVTGYSPPAGATERLDTAADAPSEAFAIFDTPVSAGATGVRTGAANGTTTAVVTVTMALQDTNAAPNAPTLTGPIGSTAFDRASTQRFSWAFSDPNPGDSQSKFDLRYRLVGSPTWTDVTGTTPNQYWDAAGGTFAAGNYEWQARTYDSTGTVGPYSASAYFTAANVPAAPTITDPTNGSTISTAAKTVTWSTPSQTSYQLRRVADSSGSPNTGTVYEDTGEVVEASTRTRAVTFAVNGRVEHVQVRVKANGLWSPWGSVRVTASYTPPATATVSLVPGTATLSVAIANPTPTGTQPVVSYHDVYVNDDGNGFTRRATQVAPGVTWVYRTPRSGLDYAGRVLVVTYGANGTSANTVA